jgi:hypothetical protein
MPGKLIIRLPGYSPAENGEQDNRWHRLAADSPTHPRYSLGKYRHAALRHPLHRSPCRPLAVRVTSGCAGMQPRKKKREPKRAPVLESEKRSGPADTGTNYNLTCVPEETRRQCGKCPGDYPFSFVALLQRIVTT